MECKDGISSQGSQDGIYVKYAGVLWTRTVGEAERAGIRDKVTDVIEVARACGKPEEV